MGNRTFAVLLATIVLTVGPGLLVGYTVMTRVAGRIAAVNHARTAAVLGLNDPALAPPQLATRLESTADSAASKPGPADVSLRSEGTPVQAPTENLTASGVGGLAGLETGGAGAGEPAAMAKQPESP